MSHDPISRFLRTEDYSAKKVWDYIKQPLRCHEESKDGVLVLDDTISEKNYTDENVVNCWHYLPAKARYVKEINLLS